MPIVKIVKKNVQLNAVYKRCVKIVRKKEFERKHLEKYTKQRE